jgi:hypothetical protein
MKKLNIPFRIDKQYENWQFELDSLPTRKNGYESYRYIGKKLNLFLNFSTTKSELIFNADYLTAVIITFEDNNNPSIIEIENCLIASNFIFKGLLHNSKTFEYAKRLYCIYINPKKSSFYLIYGKTRFIKKHLLLLQKH